MSSETEQRTLVDAQTLTTAERLSRAATLVEEAHSSAALRQVSILLGQAQSRLATAATNSEALSTQERHAVYEAAQTLGSVQEITSVQKAVVENARQARQLIEDLGESPLESRGASGGTLR